MSKALITQKLLEELYDAWERNTSCFLNQICDQEKWDRDEFEEVVKNLDDRYLIKSRGMGWNYQATSDGVVYIEDQGILPRERVAPNKQARKDILRALAKFRSEHGRNERIHFEKLCEAEGIDKGLFLRNERILCDQGLIKTITIGCFQITDEGMSRVTGS
jgi:hypothetical protein